MENKKADILITLYKQQQSTAHILRDRINKIAAAVTGLFIAIDGWIFSSKIALEILEISLLIISILTVLAIAIYSLQSRFKEFSAVGRMIVRIETALMIYEPGYFLDGESLYPAEHQALGKEDYEHGRNIVTPHIYILGILAALSIGIVLFA
jgi:hypothetical protein